MNILFVFNIYPGIGGIESVSGNIIEYLGRNHSIYTLSIVSSTDIPAPTCIQGSYRFSSIADKPACVAQLNRIIAEKQIDCIVNQGIFPDISDILFDPQRVQGPRIFSFLHGMPKYEEKQYWQLIAANNRIQWMKRKLMSWLGINNKHDKYVGRFGDSYTSACRNGDKVVLLCEGYIKPFLEQYGLEAYREKVVALSNPLSAAFSAQEAIDWSAKKNRVLYVGRLSKEKRVEIILDIWHRIGAPTGWELVLVGDGEARAELEKIVHDKHLERVRFTGALPTARGEFAEAKIILLTSLYEGFALCLAEAQRFGCVPLSFDISAGVRSVVVRGGVLIAQNDRRAMADELTKLMRNDAALRALSRLAREGSNRHTIQEIGKQWEALLSEA